MENYMRLNEEKAIEYDFVIKDKNGRVIRDKETGKVKVNHRLKELEGRTAELEYFGEKFIHDFTKGWYDHYDALATATTQTSNTFVHEYKAYGDIDHIRFRDGMYDKNGVWNSYPDYHVDFVKLVYVTSEGKNTGRIPLLIVFFYDYVCVWNLLKANWETTGFWEDVNAKACEYGKKKESSYMAKLFFDPEDGKKEHGNIVNKKLDDGFWDKVKRKINEDYPGLYE